ncbi:hypothetical protein L1987_04969 [Smallanthus sonchifolius]|uniref:Uncharacterized protein n=1 Tax=Smallanthus sonchifolius TaxID=185202 RepID=A0ACB9JU11_9ASTR|nr:hypothetical protein L1987_04969 [Smallanthus sonchifolius]
MGSDYTTIVFETRKTWTMKIAKYRRESRRTERPFWFMAFNCMIFGFITRLAIPQTPKYQSFWICQQKARPCTLVITTYQEKKLMQNTHSYEVPLLKYDGTRGAKLEAVLQAC